MSLISWYKFINCWVIHLVMSHDHCCQWLFSKRQDESQNKTRWVLKRQAMLNMCLFCLQCVFFPGGGEVTTEGGGCKSEIKLTQTSPHHWNIITYTTHDRGGGGMQTKLFSKFKRLPMQLNYAFDTLWHDKRTQTPICKPIAHPDAMSSSIFSA